MLNAKEIQTSAIITIIKHVVTKEGHKRGAIQAINETNSSVREACLVE